MCKKTKLHQIAKVLLWGQDLTAVIYERIGWLSKNQEHSSYSYQTKQTDVETEEITRAWLGVHLYVRRQS